MFIVCTENEECLLTKMKVFGSIFNANTWAQVPNVNSGGSTKCCHTHLETRNKTNIDQIPMMRTVIHSIRDTQEALGGGSFLGYLENN